MASVAITRTELDSTGLRAAAAGSSDAKQARRLLALAMVLDGHPRSLAAQAGGMDRQTLRDWVHRYNAHGIEGLRDVRNKGRAPALSAEQMQELKGLVLAGPDLKQDGVVRWRCVDLQSQIKTRFEVELHERTVGKLLRRLGMTRLQPRPFHPKTDMAAQEACKETSHAWSPTPCRPRPPGRPLRSGSKTRPAWASSPKREAFAAGHPVLRVGAPRLPPGPGARLPAARAPTCSAPSAPPAPWGPPSSCPGSAARP